MKKNKLQLILLALVLLTIMSPVQAQNMTISRLGFGSDETVQIYANGTLAGTYNTTTNGIALPEEDFNLIIKPTDTNGLADPQGWLTDVAFPFVQTNVLGIVIIIILIAIYKGRN